MSFKKKLKVSCTIDLSELSVHSNVHELLSTDGKSHCLQILVTCLLNNTAKVIFLILSSIPPSLKED